MGVTVIAGSARAQPAPDYDFQWATITHAGNRPASVAEAPFLMEFPAPGRVDYEYRIARTEVTVAQWFEFVQAYAPYYTGARSASAFVGLSIVPTSTDPTQPAGYRILNGEENRPASMSWRYAARYVNWLHNDKRPEREAFEQGVYDTSTFTQNPDGSYNDQLTRSPGARFCAARRCRLGGMPAGDWKEKTKNMKSSRPGSEKPSRVNLAAVRASIR